MRFVTLYANLFSQYFFCPLHSLPAGDDADPQLLGQFQIGLSIQDHPFDHLKFLQIGNIIVQDLQTYTVMGNGYILGT